MSPVRVQMSRQRPWRAEHPDAVIVARPGRWGNPFRVHAPEIVVHDDGRDWWAPSSGARALAVALYRSEVLPTLDMSELAGRDLACWCALDAVCHGDALLEAANGGAA